MSRALLVLDAPAVREKAKRWIDQAPVGTRVEYKAPKRSLEQNAMMWACLTEVADQVTHHGLKLTTEDWKLIFVDALKRENRIAPNLDGTGFVSLGRSTSDLSKDEMTDLIELILAFGAKHGVTFKDHAAANENTDDAGSSSLASTEEVGDSPASTPDPASSTETPWIVTAARMLWAATHRPHGQATTDDMLDVLNNQRKAVGAIMPEGTDQKTKDKAGSIYTRCKQVVMMEIDHHDAKAIIAGIAGITEGELGQ